MEKQLAEFNELCPITPENNAPRDSLLRFVNFYNEIKFVVFGNIDFIVTEYDYFKKLSEVLKITPGRVKSMKNSTLSPPEMFKSCNNVFSATPGSYEYFISDTTYKNYGDNMKLETQYVCMRILHRDPFNEFPGTNNNTNITPSITDLFKCFELQKILTPGDDEFELKQLIRRYNSGDMSALDDMGNIPPGVIMKMLVDKLKY